VQTYRDESIELTVRLDAARAPAPYIHPRLSTAATALDAQISARPLLEWTDKELEAAIARIGDRMAGEADSYAGGIDN
jgi:hypothetical protein